MTKTKKIKEAKYVWIVFLISLVALLLRLYRLGQIPVSLHWDEASWGYNAYSVLKTGKDEYGKFLPLIFKAFGDYKSPVYVYLTVPTVAIFGLTEFAVRLPAAIFGAISVALLYFVIKEIFKDFKEVEVLGIISSLVLALSPWSYHYSHGAWEVNILLVFFFLGILFFLKASKKSLNFLWLSAFFFGLCFYVYNSAKLLIPLIVLGLALYFKDKIRQISWRNIFLAGAILVVMVLPIAKSTFFGGAGGRLKLMSIFSFPRPASEAFNIAQEEGGTPQSLIYKLFHGSFHYFFRGILGRYLNHFSPRFLFFEGDWSIPRHSVPLSGQMNLLDIIFLPLGVYFVVSRKIKSQSFLWYLLLIAPLPAALSRDVVQATRSFFMIIPLTIFSAFGIYFVIEQLGRIKKVFRLGLFGVLIFGYLFSFGNYLDQFFVHTPIKYSQYWQYGYKEVINFIADKTHNYDKVIFTQKYGQPYIYYLFYTRYEPKLYQPQAKLIENPQGDVGRVEKIDNIEFRDIYWPAERFIKNRLLIGAAYEIPKNNPSLSQFNIIPSESRILKEIDFLDREPAFLIVETVK